MTVLLQTEIADTLRVTVQDWRDRLRPDWDALVPQLVEVAVIITFAMLFYRLIRGIIRRVIEKEVEDDDPIAKRLRQQRVHTVGGLLANITAVVLVIVTALTILGTFGVSIAPILASVGVLGLAVSFGAQSLVKDVISGTFMLLEGQFGIGDVVRLGDAAGVVEKITLRTTVLRDLQGIVHIIPNGEITRVSNMTKAWSRAVLDIGVAYKEDVDRVIAVLRNEGERFHTDPEFGQLLLEPPQVLGVDSFADSAVVIRMVAKTLPMKQWDVARELRRRIKKRFDAEGIEIPFPHVTFYWGEGQAQVPATGGSVGA
ncbi:MAG TPA: mechanosensitive ion channel family protein [Longimicrobiales bacterium]|nr:mechanosensitive ion channel family protein [Longimicrobiales bacterium]